MIYEVWFLCWLRRLEGTRLDIKFGNLEFCLAPLTLKSAKFLTPTSEQWRRVIDSSLLFFLNPPQVPPDPFPSKLRYCLLIPQRRGGPVNTCTKKTFLNTSTYWVPRRFLCSVHPPVALNCRVNRLSLPLIAALTLRVAYIVRLVTCMQCTYAIRAIKYEKRMIPFVLVGT